MKPLCFTKGCLIPSKSNLLCSHGVASRCLPGHGNTYDCAATFGGMGTRAALWAASRRQGGSSSAFPFTAVRDFTHTRIRRHEGFSTLRPLRPQVLESRGEAGAKREICTFPFFPSLQVATKDVLYNLFLPFAKLI